MIPCSKCKCDKDFSEFRKVPTNRNKRGYYSHCKQCEAITKKKSYEKNKPHYFVKAHESRSRNKHKAAARALAAYHIKQGNIVKLPCEHPGCDRTDVDAHHDDYNKPKEVMFLCRPHHHARHKELEMMGIVP